MNDKDFARDFVLVGKGEVIRTKNLKLEGDVSFTRMKVSSRLGNMPSDLNGDITRKFLMKSPNWTQVDKSLDHFKYLY